jgi:hypothetical protein
MRASSLEVALERGPVAVELEPGLVAVEPELVQAVAEPGHDQAVAVPEHDPVVAEPGHDLAVVEPGHDPVAVVPEHDPVVAEQALVQVAVALKTKSVTAAHRRGLPLLAAEDLVAVAGTTREPAAAEAVIAWEVAE